MERVRGAVPSYESCGCSIAAAAGLLRRNVEVPGPATCVSGVMASGDVVTELACAAGCAGEPLASEEGGVGVFVGRCSTLSALMI